MKNLLHQPESKTLEFKRDTTSPKNWLKKRQWGTGVRRIFSEAHTQGLPEPKIEEIGMRLRFTIPLRDILPLAAAQSRKRQGLESWAESGAESGAESNLSRLVFLVAEHPRSKSELAKALGMPRVTGALNRTVRQLMDEGLLGYTLPDKPNSRLQKYRLTPKGKQLLEGRE